MQETTSFPFYSVYQCKMLNKEASTKLCGLPASLYNKLALWVRDLFCGCQFPDFLSNSFGILRHYNSLTDTNLCLSHLNRLVSGFWSIQVSATKMFKLFSSVKNPFRFSERNDVCTSVYNPQPSISLLKQLSVITPWNVTVPPESAQQTQCLKLTKHYSPGELLNVMTFL